LAQLERWQELNLRRAKLAQLYFEGLKDISGIDLPEFRNMITFMPASFCDKNTGLNRDDFMNRLADIISDTVCIFLQLMH